MQRENIRARQMQKPAKLISPEKKGRQDFSIWLITLSLVLLGIVMVFSASSYMATLLEDDPYYYFKKQIIGAVLGFVAMLFLSRFDYHLYRRFKWVIVVVPILMLLAVFIPGIGVNINGSSRWLNLRVITIQPSEVAKFALVIFMAIYMSDKKVNMQDFWRGVLPMLAIVGGVCGIIILQPNFSMVVCIVMITAAMVFMGGMRMSHFFMLGGIAVAAGVVLILIEPYRLERLMSYLDPWSDPLDSGYQLIQSFYAIASGGLFGKGLGMSQQKLMFLPFRESDFIFSIYAEEFGFVGVLLLMALYLFLIYRGIRIAIACRDKFGSLLAGGITSLLAVQVIINVAVVTGCVPPTGQTLPFISAGSSSLIMFMAAMGALLNVSQNCVKTS